MDNLLKRHIELVEAVNNSKTEIEHESARNMLRGFRQALEIMDIFQLSECGMHYIDQGIARPMCCGVFLDWKPQHISETCTDSECHECGEKDCPHREPLHYHHDGCPACDCEPADNHQNPSSYGVLY